MTKFDELKERYPNLIPVQELRANVSIIDLALHYGYELKPHKGRSRPVLEHSGYGDTIIIKNPQDAGQQLYQRAGDFTDSGTVIDFIRNRLATVFSTFNRPGEHEFRNITAVLYDYLRIDPDQLREHRRLSTPLSEPAPKQLFAKELFDIRPLDPDNYLTRRHIAPQTINSPEFTSKVVAQITYFDTQTGHSENFLTARQHPERQYLQFTNVAFPYYNGQSTEVTGLELRSEKVKLHAAGSDRYSSVFVSNPPPKAEGFYVMESAIDALSHRQLRTIQGDTAFNAVYFSTGGQLTPQQVNTITRYIGAFAKADNWSIHLGFDNDTKGHQFDLQFIQQLTAPRFPLSPAVGSAGRVAYLLPEGDAYRPMREQLLDRVDGYNKHVEAHFTRAEGDTLGQRERSAQLITVSRNGQQVQVSIPEACEPLAMLTRLLLEVTNLGERIRISKSWAKDFNEELTREVQLGEKFRYAIKDETGLILINGNSPQLMARALQQIKHQGEGDGQSMTYTLIQRESFGFQRPQHVIRLEQGQCVEDQQSAEFSQQVKAEKQQGRGEKTSFSPAAKPSME